MSPDDSLSAVVTPAEDESVFHVTQSTATVCSSRLSRSSRSSRSSGSSRSSISSIRQREQAEHATLLARAASLKQKEALELEECKLKAKKDQLEIKTAIAASSAKIKVLDNCEYENQQYAIAHSETKSVDNLLSKQEPAVKCEQHTERSQVNNKVKQEKETKHTYISNDAVNLCEVMLKQNDITEMLVKQQKLTHLPQRDIPVFSGDPLEFNSFIFFFSLVKLGKRQGDMGDKYIIPR